MNPTYRLLKTSDYKMSTVLWISTPGVGLNSVDDTVQGITRFLERNPRTCFVASIEREKEIIGVILAGNDGRRGAIYHLAVAKPHQRKGIASQLVQKALTALAAEDISKVALVAFKNNKTGNQFWEKQGFSMRHDIIYRNKTLVEIEKTST